MIHDLYNKTEKFKYLIPIEILSGGLVTLFIGRSESANSVFPSHVDINDSVLDNIKDIKLKRDDIKINAHNYSTREQKFEKQLKLSKSDKLKEGIIEGYGAIKHTPSNKGDILEDKSFSKTLKDVKERGIYFNHIYDVLNLLGFTEKLEEDKKGLLFVGRITIEYPECAKVLDFVERKIATELSVTYLPIKAKWEDVYVKEKYVASYLRVSEAMLTELSITTKGFAAHRKAKMFNMNNINLAQLYMLVKNNINNIDFVNSLKDLIHKPLSNTCVNGGKPLIKNTNHTTKDSFFMELSKLLN
jgi:HK97 family phage prohead protease